MSKGRDLEDCMGKLSIGNPDNDNQEVLEWCKQNKLGAELTQTLISQLSSVYDLLGEKMNSIITTIDKPIVAKKLQAAIKDYKSKMMGEIYNGDNNHVEPPKLSVEEWVSSSKLPSEVSI